MRLAASRDGWGEECMTERVCGRADGWRGVNVGEGAEVGMGYVGFE